MSLDYFPIPLAVAILIVQANVGALADDKREEPVGCLETINRLDDSSDVEYTLKNNCSYDIGVLVRIDESNSCMVVNLGGTSTDLVPKAVSVTAKMKILASCTLRRDNRCNYSLSATIQNKSSLCQ